MEQTNLVVTSDGKTWDEATRDTSYIAFHTGMMFGGTDGTAANTELIPSIDYFRGRFGTNATENNCIQKNMALGYDSIFCLEEGWYEISMGVRKNDSNTEHQLYCNLNVTNNSSALAVALSYGSSGNVSGINRTFHAYLKRGDFVNFRHSSVSINDNGQYNAFSLRKLEK